jgi:acetyltransferase-like isoleucine patch superfamily enzyme
MLREWLSGLRDRNLLRSYVRAGLKLGHDVRVIGKPDFGSEPYLIEIGNHVTVSSNVTFITHDGATWVFRHLPPYLGLQRFGRIVIGDNCFIGASAIIMPDVSIGSNSVVGAGAVVTRSVPANSVVAGVPARRICSYEEYVERMILRCRSYPPDVTADRKKLKDVLLSAIPHPTTEEGQSPARPGSLGET